MSTGEDATIWGWDTVTESWIKIIVDVNGRVIVTT